MEDQNYIKRYEHNEFVKRMEAEHDRQNHRICKLEGVVEQIGSLTVSIEKMTVTMEQMIAEQKIQGERLVELESRDGKMWRKISSYIVTAVVGAVVCYILTNIGL